MSGVDRTGAGDQAGGDGDRQPDRVALPEEAWWVALACLPGMGPARLRALHQTLTAEEAWHTVVAGRAHTLPLVAALLGSQRRRVEERWSQAASQLDVVGCWRAHAHLGVSVLGQPAHPVRVVADPEPPVLLFSEGDRSAFDGPTVAIVGTRRCTQAGADVATELGALCARAGVRVISGLAVGIDAAAHRGALSAGSTAAPTVAVVASGLDYIYPPQNRELWQEIATRGLLLSEYTLGTEPSRWRFPARNRLIAALADAVVVVESPRSGGSMYTVDEALQRDRTVLAVPGPLHSPASAGTNWLLSQGATVVAQPEDVLTAVGVTPVGHGETPMDESRPEPVGDSRRVLRAVGWAPATLDVLARRTGLGLGPLAVALDRLEVDGWITRDNGYVERKL